MNIHQTRLQHQNLAVEFLGFGQTPSLKMRPGLAQDCVRCHLRSAAGGHHSNAEPCKTAVSALPVAGRAENFSAGAPAKESAPCKKAKRRFPVGIVCPCLAPFASWQKRDSLQVSVSPAGGFAKRPCRPHLAFIFGPDKRE